MELKEIIIKQIVGTITKEETIELQNLLKHPSNQKELELILKEYHDINLSMLNNNTDKAYDTILHEIEKLDPQKTIVKRLYGSWYKYAAVIIALIGLTWFFKDSIWQSNQNEFLIPQNESITLQLDNGEIKRFDLSKSEVIKNSKGQTLGVQDANSLDYSLKTSKSKLSYNTLNIPNGKQFKLRLSDSTIVYLNSGSSITYPSFFLENGIREVFLEGEAYFEVSPNKEKPFLLHTNLLDIQVLGTKFNVEAYKGTISSDVVLVEGSVSLNPKNATNSKVKLSPNQKGSLSNNDESLKVSEVDTYLYTSWLDGKLVFRNMKFKYIIEKLERSFNVKIKNSNQELGNEFFNASFENQSINDILSYFKETHDIEYSIKNNTVFIE